jgi:uncharacterized protein involved in outer membrane biogenesis
VKIIKYFVISSAIIFFSVILLIIAFIFLFDLSKYKTGIEKTISEQLNRKVEITGELNLSLYPLFSLDINGISIYNSSVFKDKHFLTIEKVNISLDLIKAYQEKRIIVKNISIIEPKVNLINLDNNTNNWSDLINNFENDSSNKKEVKSTEKSKNFKMAVDNIKLQRGEINYRNNKNNQEILLDNLNIIINNLDKNKIGKYNVSTWFASEPNKFKLEAKGSFKNSLEGLELLGNTLNLTNIEINNNKQDDIKFSFLGNLNSKSKIIELNDINVNFNKYKLVSKLQIKLQNGEEDIKGSFDLHYNKKLKIYSKLDYKKEELKLTDINIVYGDIKGNGNLLVSFMDKVDIKYLIKLGEIDIDKLRSNLAKDKSENNGKKDYSDFLTISKNMGILNSKIDRLSLDGKLLINNVEIGNKKIDNISLHTTVKKNEFINNLKLQYMETYLNTDLHYKYDSLQSMLTFGVHANTLSLKDLVKREMKKFATLNRPSLKFVLISNKGEILLKKLDFNALINNKVFNIELVGNMDKSDGDIQISASKVSFNKSNFNIQANSNSKEVLKNIKGSITGHVDLNDITYLIDSSKDIVLSSPLEFRTFFDINLVDSIFNFTKGWIAYEDTHLNWETLGRFKKPLSLDLTARADYINVDKILALYGAIKGKNNDQIKDQNFRKDRTESENIRLNVVLETKKLILDKLTFERVYFKGFGENKKYTLDVDSIFYNGKLKGLLHIDTSSNVPAFELNSKIIEVSMDEFFKDIVNKSVFTGIGDIEAEVNSYGRDVKELISTLNGKIFLNLKKGTLNGINIGFVLRNIFSLIGYGELIFNKSLQDYAEAKATLDAKNGILYNNDLLIYSPFFKIRGEGVINVPENDIDYNIYLSLLKPVFDNSSVDINNALYTDILDKEILMHYKGPIKNPRQEIDYMSYIEKTLGRKLKKEIVPIKRKVDKFLKEIF